MSAPIEFMRKIDPRMKPWFLILQEIMVSVLLVICGPVEWYQLGSESLTCIPVLNCTISPNGSADCLKNKTKVILRTLDLQKAKYVSNLCILNITIPREVQWTCTCVFVALIVIHVVLHNRWLFIQPNEDITLKYHVYEVRIKDVMNSKKKIEQEEQRLEEEGVGNNDNLEQVEAKNRNEAMLSLDKKKKRYDKELKSVITQSRLLVGPYLGEVKGNFLLSHVVSICLCTAGGCLIYTLVYNALQTSFVCHIREDLPMNYTSISCTLNNESQMQFLSIICAAVTIAIAVMNLGLVLYVMLTNEFDPLRILPRYFRNRRPDENGPGNSNHARQPLNSLLLLNCLMVLQPSKTSDSQQENTDHTGPENLENTERSEHGLLDFQFDPHITLPSEPVRIEDQLSLDFEQIRHLEETDSSSVEDLHDLQTCTAEADQLDSDRIYFGESRVCPLLPRYSKPVSVDEPSTSSQVSEVWPVLPPVSRGPMSPADSHSDHAEQPSNFSDILDRFRSHIASLRADPKRLDAIRQSRIFQLCLQSIAYRISVCRYDIDRYTRNLKHDAKLYRLGFYRKHEGEEVVCEEEQMNDALVDNDKLTKLLDQARHLGLRQDVDNVTRACQLDLEIRKLVSVSYEGTSGRPDLFFTSLLMNIAECVNHLSERQKAWPSWSDLEQSRQRIMDPVKLYGYEDRHEAQWLVLQNLLLVSDNLLQSHAADVCKHFKFHFRYLDQELGYMLELISDRSVDDYVHAMARLLVADDAKFCRLVRTIEARAVLEKGSFYHKRPTLVFGLRLYRLFLRMDELDLAEEVLERRFADETARHSIGITPRLLSKLQNDPCQPTERIHLNGDHDDFTGEYKLPKLSPVGQEAGGDIRPRRPWWVRMFKQHRQQNIQSVEIVKPTDLLLSYRDRSATTTVPYERRRAEFPWLQYMLDARAGNREAARLFSCMQDFDITFPDVPCAAVRNPTTLKRQSDCSKQESMTNLETGVPYHCHVLTYHPIQDEWTARSNMCRISGPLAVEEPGGTRVLLAGDCGEYVPDDYFVFKIRTSYRVSLRECMAAVTSQSISSWYVNRFSEVTQDQFGGLRMLHSDLVMVYQDSHRDTILELMTREQFVKDDRRSTFGKYTNNTSFKNKKVSIDLLEAFSHFTHHASEGTLVVTNMQGWVSWSEAKDGIIYTLTDPAIHCPGQPHRFGHSNLEQNGIDLFFGHVHTTCNYICKSLNLTRSEEYSVPISRPDVKAKTD